MCSYVYALIYLCFLQGKLDVISKLKQAEADLANAQESIEAEQDSKLKAELQKQSMNANSKATNWKNKFDSEATSHIEELENAKYVYLISKHKSL